jgi:glycine oxidase
VGAACARELARLGREVLVLEPASPMGQAWRAAAGMLASQIEADASDPLLPLAVRAREYYSRLAPELLDSTGIDLGLWRQGIARVATDEADAEALRRKVSWQQDNGFSCEWLESEQCRQRWPWLAPVIGALFAPEDGALNPERLVQALLADARQLGARVEQDRAVSVETQGGRVTGVVGERLRYPTRQAVIAAGAWSSRISGLPRVLPVRPVRGQMAAVPWPVAMDRAIVYHKDSYLLARDDEAILGSTMEEAGFDSEVTPAGVARIFASTLTLCPGLIRSKVRRTWAGLRPMTPDGLPVLGPDPELSGLWYATGHGRNGILLAGLTGRILAELMAGKPSDPHLAGLGPGRFKTS